MGIDDIAQLGAGNGIYFRIRKLQFRMAQETEKKVHLGAAFVRSHIGPARQSGKMANALKEFHALKFNYNYMKPYKI